MDKQGNVVGVFSRLVVPEGASESADSDGEPSESGSEQERRIFLMSILDRLPEFSSAPKSLEVSQ